MQPRRGRPPHPLDPDASHAARLGAEIRTRRQAQGLTLQALATLIDFSPQHVSEVELAKTPPSGPFVAACDQALDARGTLVALLPVVVREHALQRENRATARLGRLYATRTTVLAGEARCWLWLDQPGKAVDAAQDALASWPAIRRRGRGLQRAGLAVACAAAGEPDRAAHEGLQALTIAHATGSERTMRELRRLDQRLAATPGAQGAARSREAFAAAR